MIKSRGMWTTLFVLLVSTACAAGPNSAAQSYTGDPAGFWQGLWQGFISPITFLVSLVNSDINIYEVNNNGNWYNFGFMIGVSAVFTGLARSGMAARSSSRARSAASGPSPAADGHQVDGRRMTDNMTLILDAAPAARPDPQALYQGDKSDQNPDGAPDN